LQELLDVLNEKEKLIMYWNSLRLTTSGVPEKCR